MASESTLGRTDIGASGMLAGVVPLLGRILMSILFFVSGVGKISAPDATIGFIASVGLPLPQLGLVIAVFVEIVCSVALVLGYRTRLVAAIFAAYCLATAIFFHTHFADQNQFIHFFKNISMMGGFIQIIAFGAGTISIGAKRR